MYYFSAATAATTLARSVRAASVVFATAFDSYSFSMIMLYLGNYLSYHVAKATVSIRMETKTPLIHDCSLAGYDVFC